MRSARSTSRGTTGIASACAPTTATTTSCSTRRAPETDANRAAENAARDILRGDWDADGTIAAYLPRDAAITLLREYGWVADNPRAPWVSPHGHLAYSVGEALQFALLANAEAIEAPPELADLVVTYVAAWQSGHADGTITGYAVDEFVCASGDNVSDSYDVSSAFVDRFELALENALILLPVVVGVPYAHVDPATRARVCPVCGEHVAERFDVDGEEWTNNYAEHYAREHAA